MFVVLLLVNTQYQILTNVNVDKNTSSQFRKRLRIILLLLSKIL